MGNDMIVLYPEIQHGKPVIPVSELQWHVAAVRVLAMLSRTSRVGSNAVGGHVIYGKTDEMSAQQPSHVSTRPPCWCQAVRAHHTVPAFRAGGRSQSRHKPGGEPFADA